MSGRYKRKEVEENPSDDDGGAPAPKKAATKAGASEPSEEIVVCDISHNRKVKVRNWKGKVWVDIREFYYGKDGTQFPGKKGISLTVDQWKALRDHAEEIDKALDDS